MKRYIFEGAVHFLLIILCLKSHGYAGACDYSTDKPITKCIYPSLALFYNVLDAAPGADVPETTARLVQLVCRGYNSQSQL